MLSKRSLATGQRWLRELAIEAESKTGVLVDVFGSEMTGAWDKKQYEAVQEAAFRRGQAVAYSRAADLIGEYFRSPERKPRAEVTPTLFSFHANPLAHLFY